MTQITIYYFSWLATRLGRQQEQMETAAQTARQLANELAARGGDYQIIFAQPESIQVAINHALSDWESPIPPSSEVAFFPPMTGG